MCASTVPPPLPIDTGRRQQAIALTVLAIVAAGCVVWAMMQRRAAPVEASLTPAPSRAELEQAAQIRARLDEAVNKGALYSVDYARHKLRINPRVWDALNVDQKRAMVGNFRGYYQNLHEPDFVSILSSKNDECFASYTWWSVEIHR